MTYKDLFSIELRQWLDRVLVLLNTSHSTTNGATFRFSVTDVILLLGKYYVLYVIYAQDLYITYTFVLVALNFATHIVNFDSHKAQVLYSNSLFYIAHISPSLMISNSFLGIWAHDPGWHLFPALNNTREVCSD